MWIFFFHILLQIIQPLQQGDLTAYPPVVESPRHWVVREGEMGSKLRPKAAAAFQASVGFPGQMFLSVLSAFGQFPELWSDGSNGFVMFYNCFWGSKLGDFLPSHSWSLTGQLTF